MDDDDEDNDDDDDDDFYEDDNDDDDDCFHRLLSPQERLIPLSKVHSLSQMYPPLCPLRLPPWLRLTSPSVADLPLVGRRSPIKDSLYPCVLNVTMNDL